MKTRGTLVRGAWGGFLLLSMGLWGAQAAASNYPAWAPEAEIEPTVVLATLNRMVGCFRVTYSFVEDGAHDAFFKPILEKATLSATSPFHISREMILDGESQPHWTEEWTPTAGGLWRQTVVGPFGDDRYTCDGQWLLNQWRCTADNAGKPRRDKGRPYAYLRRENTLQITDKRWVHSQINHKVTEAGDLFATEVGWNVYERVDDELCVAKPPQP